MNATYKIAEVSRRSGFNPSTLRYYEDIGLLPTPPRTDNGYRTYDDRSLFRLEFIARAKQLGCTLEEIAGLVAVWEGQHCAPVQARLRELVSAKIEEGEGRVAELTAFTAELRRAASTLAQHTPDGPCDDHCGCANDPPPSSTISAVQLGHRAAAKLEEPPIACTLSAAEMPDRMGAWQEVLRFVATREPLGDGVRLAFAPGAPIGEIASLVAAEHGCCAFLRFALTTDVRGTALEVRAPADAVELVHSLFGNPA